MTGASYTGTFQRVFIGDGFHARARRPDGGPAMEGYLIQISSGAFMLGGYTPLAEGVPVPPAGDRRRTMQPLDVPVIEILGEGEAETHEAARRPDSDAEGDRYRLYEVAGARPHDRARCGPARAAGGGRAERLPDGHAGRRRAAQPAPLGGRRRAAAARRAPGDLAGALAGPLRASRPRRVRCCATSTATPCAAFARRGSTCRSPATIRTARRARQSRRAGGSRPGRPRLAPADVADLMGCMTRFAPEKLRALYGTPEGYRARFEAALERLVDERWIALADAERARALAAEVTF